MIAPAQTLIAHYLPPELAAQFVQEPDPTPTTRAAVAAYLRQSLAAYVAYVPERLVRAHLADPLPGRIAGVFWHGSLLFADLSGFTAFSEKLSVLGKQGAEEVSAVVNRLFDALVSEVFAYQGSLLKFGGDALTAFFDAATLGEAHAAAASHAALAMQAHMQAFAAVQTRLGVFRLALRVGVHSGQVFAAEVGDSSHMELVITGREVNRVAEAQEIAAPGEVVVSDQTACLLTGATLLPRRDGFHQLGSLDAIGLPSPQPLPVVLDGPDDLATLTSLAQQVAALRPYLVRGLPRRFLDTSITELGEFRPVTVLFANFHDCSALLHRPDIAPDRAALLLNAYFRRAQEVVHRYGGIVNKVDMYTHGDKLMALFGAPTAHEDDPVRAVHCALELEHALLEANAEIVARLNGIEDEAFSSDSAQAMLTTPSAFLCPLDGLRQRIGINTGTVFAGRVGGTRRYEYTVMGPAVNLSARLMAAARDGTVLLSPATRQAVEHQVEVADQPPLSLKGLSAPIVPSVALAIRETERAARPTEIGLGQPPLVGREDELTLLKTAALAALRGHGRVLAVVGDAGIGKSRLCGELIHSLVLASLTGPGAPAPGYAEQAWSHSSSLPPFEIYTGDCQSYEQSMPYIAIRPLLRDLLRWVKNPPLRNPEQERDPDVQEALLVEAFTRLYADVHSLVPHLSRFTPLLGDALGFTFPETDLTRALTAEQRHDRLQELIVALVLTMAGRRPLLLLLEDMQWADASSLEVLHRIAQAAQHVPLLLLFNYRPAPPIAEDWTALPSTIRLVLTELAPERSEELIAALLKEEPPAAILTLLDRTQGNPFYIEELVRTLVLSHILTRDELGHWQLTRSLDQAAIPSSIQGLIVARLDRLAEAPYKLVQVASVIGRRFQCPILEPVYDDPEPLEVGLQNLTATEIIASEPSDDIVGVGLQPTPTSYLFRHALLRDVAYEGILYARRRELHLRVAERIEALHATRRDTVLALLAHHYLLAEAWERAFHYHLAAGRQAQSRYANREALALLETARTIVPHLDVILGTTALTAHVLEMYERIGDIHALIGEYDQSQTAYQDALTLLAEWRKEHHLWRTDKGTRLMLPAPFSTINMRLHRLMACIEERRSNYQVAFDWIERGLAWATTETQDELARCYLRGAGIYYLQGAFNQALAWAGMGLAVAEQLNDRANQAHAWKLIGNLRAEQGEFGEGIQALERAHALWDEVQDLNGLNKILSDLGAVYDDAGRWQDALTYYEQSLAISENIGDASAIADASNNLAVALVKFGDLQRAYELYTHSGDKYRQMGSIWGIALTDCNCGEVLFLQDKPTEALDLFQSSIAAFERIGARTSLPEVLRLAAEATLALGNHDQATSYVLRSLALSQELGMAIEAAVAQRVLGQIALVQSDTARATTALEQSRIALEQLNERYELGRVLVWQARLARYTGQPEHMTAPLRQAIEIFAELDARRDLALATALAAEGGAGFKPASTQSENTQAPARVRFVS